MPRKDEFNDLIKIFSSGTTKMVVSGSRLVGKSFLVEEFLAYNHQKFKYFVLNLACFVVKDVSDLLFAFLNAYLKSNIETIGAMIKRILRPLEFSTVLDSMSESLSSPSGISGVLCIDSAQKIKILPEINVRTAFVSY